MSIEEVSMAKRIKKEKSVIVLNAMYSGKYLNDNMGHEIINLFKTTNSIKIGDKEQSQLYRYWESAKEDVGEINISGFILCPEYKLADLESEKSSKIFGENYTIISYKKIIVRYLLLFECD